MWGTSPRYVATLNIILHACSSRLIVNNNNKAAQRTHRNNVMYAYRDLSKISVENKRRPKRLEDKHACKLNVERRCVDKLHT